MGFMGLIVAGGVTGVYLGFRRRAIEAARREQLWRDFARRRGGAVVEPTHLFGSLEDDVGGRKVMRRGVAVELLVADVEVLIDTYAGETPDGLLTRFVAARLLGDGPGFTLTPRRALDLLTPSTGGLGSLAELDEALLERFTLTTVEPERVSELLGPRARALLKSTFGESTLAGDEALVVLTVPAAVAQERLLEAGVELVTEVAVEPRQVVEALRSVEGGHYRRPEGRGESRRGPRSELELLGATVVIEPSPRVPWRRLRVWAEPLRRLPRLQLEIDREGVPTTEPPRGVLTPTVADMLAVIGRCSLSCDQGEVALELDFAGGERRWLAAAQAVASLSTDSGGAAFR